MMKAMMEMDAHATINTREAHDQVPMARMTSGSRHSPMTTSKMSFPSFPLPLHHDLPHDMTESSIEHSKASNFMSHHAVVTVSFHHPSLSSLLASSLLALDLPVVLQWARTCRTHTANFNGKKKVCKTKHAGARSGH